MDPTRRPEHEDPNEPRTGGQVTNMAPVQIALALLALFVGLLFLWIVWPLIS